MYTPKEPEELVVLENNMININNDWQEFFDIETKKDYYLELREFLKSEYKTQTIYPPMNDIFNAFKMTALSNVKVIIIGQDPYHGKGQGMGLSFSVNDGIRIPPSLRNIYKELELEGFHPDTNTGNLTKWAGQGVFLLNSCLTVREHKPNSHAGKGWEVFTNNAIKFLEHDERPKVFLLWGNYAQKKAEIITNPKHLILKSAHPSPFSADRGFFGNNHFIKTNEFLKENNIKEIEW
jgi:uracil-DNA glycosylase